jgi:hypothetical protein
MLTMLWAWWPNGLLGFLSFKKLNITICRKDQSPDWSDEVVRDQQWIWQEWPHSTKWFLIFLEFLHVHNNFVFLLI